MAPNVLTNVVQGLVLIFVLSLVSMMFFQGTHKYYEMLKVCHKVPSDYDPVIEVRGDIPDGVDLEDLASPNELWSGDGRIVHESTNPEVNRDPQIVVDLDRGVKRIKGENPVRKGMSLAFWTGVASIVPLAFVLFYFLIFGGTFTITEDAGLTSIAVLILVIGFHFSIRIVSLVNHEEWSYSDEERAEEFQEDVHEFAYSFFLSLFLLGSFGLVIDTFRNGLGSFIGSPSGNIWFILLLTLLLIVLPILSAAISQMFLRMYGKQAHLTDDYIRDEIPLDL